MASRSNKNHNVKNPAAKQARLYEIWRLHMAGYSSTRIGNILGISTQAVNNYKRSDKFREYIRLGDIESRRRSRQTERILEKLEKQAHESLRALQAIAVGEYTIVVDGVEKPVKVPDTRDLIKLHQWFVERHPDAQPRLHVSHEGGTKNEYKISIETMDEGKSVAEDARKLLDQGNVIDIPKQEE